ARHLWTKRYRENGRQTSLDEMVAAYEGRELGPRWENLAEPQIAYRRIARVLRTAGQKCMQLLTAFYYDNMDMDGLATDSVFPANARQRCKNLNACKR